MRHDFSKVNKKKVAVVVACCFAAICLIFYLFQNKSPQGGNREVIAPEVEVYTLERKDMMRQVPLFGQTVATAQIALAPKYSGRVTEVRVQLGDWVREGDVLMVQDTKDMDLSVLQNQASARQAEADVMEAESIYEATYRKVSSNYELKSRNYERYVALYEQGGISKESLDLVYQELVDSKSALDTLRNQAMSGEIPASVEAKRAALAKAQSGTDSLVKQREDLVLRAPRSGMIAYRKAEVGEIAQAGQKVLELVDNSKLYVDCQVSEQDVAFVRLNMAVNVGVESLGRSYSGKITFISPAVMEDTKNYSVRIELTSVDDVLKAGMFARTKIEFVQRPKALFIPKEAVIDKNGRTTVFVIGQDKKAQERQIELGIRNDKEVEIIEGLQEGNVVAVTNLARLRDGMSPTIVNVGEKS